MALIHALLLCCFFGYGFAKQCQDLTIPVEVSARQGVFNVPTFTGNQDAIAFAQNFTSVRGGTNYTAEVLTGYANVEGSYEISARFCYPDQGPGNTVQVLTHGIGFDKTYWDLPFDNYAYSYVDAAVDSFGYSTLSYDRFGIGNSSHADPVNVVQAPAEISALYQINTALRNGSLPAGIPPFKSVVNVGHSYGSQQSYQLATMYPESTDAIILQGFSVNGSYLPVTTASFNFKLARLNQPIRFGNGGSMQDLVDAALNFVSQASGDSSVSQEIVNTTAIWDLVAGYDGAPPPIGQDLPPNYLTWSDAGANQFNFLYPTAFDPAILYYAEANKQPATAGEFLTLGPAPVISPFKGPVQILTGQQDAIYCGGDCTNTGLPNVTSIPAAAEQYFPTAKTFEAYLQPNTGHAVNLHYNSSAAYNVMNQFLIDNGIAP
ncbi:MAG: hypothetical protein Q9227_007081 [Pyrenula ochraceoflavens]